MSEPPRTLARALVAIALVLAVAVAIPSAVAHAASPTLILTPGKPSSGGPGSAATYNYTWDYSDCASNSKESDPSGLRIVLAWDDSATTPIGFAAVMTSKSGHECQGTVTGTVPANATAGDHFPQAYLEDPARGDEVVPNSNTGKVSQGQQFTVGQPHAATPAPTPTDTPVPTDTPTALTFSPVPAATSSATANAPPATAGTGGSGPSAGLLVGIAALVLVAAAVAGAVVLRRRRSRAPGDDPFEFLR